MKKGLRLHRVGDLSHDGLSDHRPDEEGIKTSLAIRGSFTRIFQTTDLMKKGLRL